MNCCPNYIAEDNGALRKLFCSRIRGRDCLACLITAAFSPLLALADPPSLDRVTRDITQFRSNKERAYTDIELFTLAGTGTFSREELRSIWDVFRRSQRPPIAAADLSALV